MEDNILHDPYACQIADETVSLLNLCYSLQSGNNCGEQPDSGQCMTDRPEFTERVVIACGYARRLGQLLPIMRCLSSVGKEMERRGEISLKTGESYAYKALALLISNYDLCLQNHDDAVQEDLT